MQGLALFKGGVLMVSHDQHLIESTVDELWAVEDNTGNVWSLFQPVHLVRSSFPNCQDNWCPCLIESTVDEVWAVEDKTGAF